MKLYSQRDARWTEHVLGWGPALGTIGQYGCFDTCLAMIATATFSPFNPAELDQFFTNHRTFVRDPTGTFDLLPDRALDLAFPGRFQTVAFAGYRADQINKAIPSKHSYAVLWISTPSVPTHFVLAYSLNGATIADPWTGHAGYLSGYGGPSAIHKTLIVTYLPPAAIPAPVKPPTPPAVPPQPIVPPVPVVVPPTPVVVVPDPQPIPCPTAAPAYDAMDQFLALLQTFVIAIIRVFQGGH